MKQIIIGTVLLALTVSTLSAQKLNTTIFDEKGKAKLLGLCDRGGLQQEPFKEWFDKNYEAYEIDQTLLEKSEGKLSDISIEIFMGTWCGDSKRGVPQFYKMMDELQFDESNITLINLDNEDSTYKQSPTGEEKGKLIHRVPTFIVYQNGEEIGRIVESPITSFEMDFAQIINGFPSSPNYKVVHELDEIWNTEAIPTEKEERLAIARRVYRSAKSYRALNTYGYVLLSRGEVDKAIATFYVNCLIFRDEANTYDSLAEAYEVNNDTEQALFFYKKYQEMKPDDERVSEKIKTLSE